MVEAETSRVPWPRRLYRAALAHLDTLLDRGARPARYLLLWLVVMAGVYGVNDSLKPYDWRVVNLFDRGATPWPANVELINLGWNGDPATRGQARRDLAAALKALADLPQLPKVVVVDIALDTTVNEELDPIRNAAEALLDKDVAIVVTGDTSAFSPVVPFAESRSRQAFGAAYAGAVDFGHALLQFDGNAYWYQPCLGVPALPVPGQKVLQCLTAVPLLVAKRFGAPTAATGPASAQAPLPTQPVLFTPGAPETFRRHTWTVGGQGLIAPSSQSSRKPRELSGAVVILGQLEADLIKCPALPVAVAAVTAAIGASAASGAQASGGSSESATPAGAQQVPQDQTARQAVLATCRRGPELLAWAIGARIAPSPPESRSPKVLDGAWWTLGFAAFFSLLAREVFGRLRRTLRHPERHLLALGLGSTALALALLAGWVTLLRLGMDVILLSVSFVAASVVVTTFTAWLSLRERLREEALTTNVNRPPGESGEGYDVFISYSHTPPENMDWVREQVYLPLKDQMLFDLDDRPGNRPLRIFFDEHAIRLGTNWYFEIAYGIQTCRCFVVIQSEDYFRKSFCNFEMVKATTRDITDGRKHFFMVPLQRPGVSVPPKDFSHLQFKPFTNPTDLVETVLALVRQSHANDGAPENRPRAV